MTGNFLRFISNNFHASLENDKLFTQALNKTKIYARVKPEEKAHVLKFF